MMSPARSKAADPNLKVVKLRSWELMVTTKQSIFEKVDFWKSRDRTY